jgi:small subunit ribosomal protein S7
MSRRRKAKKRIIIKDPIYNSTLVSMIINKILVRGKKNLAQYILYEAMKNIQESTKKDPIEILKKAISNITPDVTVKSQRVRGAVYQVPKELEPEEKMSLALRILIKSTRSRPGRSIVKKLENEILDAYNNTGGAVKQKEELHKKAQANKAFSRIRF